MGRTTRSRRIVTGALLCGMFLAAMDTLIVSAAMPDIGAALGDLHLYPWVFTLYIVGQTSTITVYGRLADRHGRRICYIVGVGCFLLGSMLCGAALSMSWLVAARLLQGIGAGGLFPITMTIVGDLYPLEARARIQGVFSSVWGIASVLGPLVGGFVVDHASWRWIFYLNLPFGVLAAWLVARHLEEPELAPRRHDLDLRAMGFFVLSVAAFLIAVLMAGLGISWDDPLVLGPGAISAMLLAVFVRRERTSPEPLLQAWLFRLRVIRVSVVSDFFACAALYGLVAYIPFMVRAVDGGSATRAGMAIAPLSLSWVVFSFLGGRWLLRVGPLATSGLGLVALACGGWAVCLVGMESGYEVLMGIMGLCGMGLGLVITTHVVAIQTAVPPRQMGAATSSMAFVRSVGSAVGAAVTGSLLLRHLHTAGIPEAMGQLRAYLQFGTAESPELLGVLPGAFRFAFMAVAVASTLALVTGLLMPRGSAQDLAWRRPESDGEAAPREASIPSGGAGDR